MPFTGEDKGYTAGKWRPLAVKLAFSHTAQWVLDVDVLGARSDIHGLTWDLGTLLS